MSKPNLDLRFPPPLSVAMYIARHGSALDAERFKAMQTHGHALTLVDPRTGRLHDTSVGAWRKRWAHWGGRGVLTTTAAAVSSDMPYVSCAEKGQYERRLHVLLTSWTEGGSLPYDDLLCLFCRPFLSFYILTNFDYWIRDIDFERRMRMRSQRPLFVLWHKVEVFALPPLSRLSYYVSPPSWWSDLECDYDLHLPSPPVFAYYSHHILRNIPFAPLIWRIACVEYSVIALLFFLMTSRRGLSSMSLRTRFRDVCSGVLFPLTSEGVLAYVRSAEVDWQNPTCVGWFTYDFQRGQARTVPTYSVDIRKRTADRIPRSGELSAVEPSFIVESLFSLEEAVVEVRRGFHQPDEGPEPELPSFPPFSNLLEDDEDLWNLDDLQPVSGSSPNLMREVLRVGAELNLDVPTRSAKIVAFLLDALKSHSRISGLESRIASLETSVSTAQTERDSARVETTREMEKGEASRFELTVARAKIEELQSLVANTSQSDILLMDSLCSEILELRDAQATIQNWLSTLRELFTCSGNEVSALRQSLVVLFDRYDDVLSVHESEVSSLSADLRAQADIAVSWRCMRDYARRRLEESQTVSSSLERQVTALKSDLESQEKKVDVVLRSRARLADSFTRLSFQAREVRLRLIDSSVAADEEFQADFRLLENEIAKRFCAYRKSLRERSQTRVQEGTAACWRSLTVWRTMLRL